MVAIPSMNDLHLEESLLINKLETVAKSADIEATLQTLKELLEHTTMHFAQEEKIMRDAAFAEYNSHKAEHDRHLSELRSIIEYFDTRKDPNAILAYIDGNLQRWMIDHVKTMDSVMAESSQS